MNLKKEITIQTTKKSFSLVNNPLTENDFLNMIRISENGPNITLKESKEAWLKRRKQLEKVKL
jgi:hypothetical protein